MFHNISRRINADGNYGLGLVPRAAKEGQRTKIFVNYQCPVPVTEEERRLSFVDCQSYKKITSTLIKTLSMEKLDRPTPIRSSPRVPLSKAAFEPKNEFVEKYGNIP